MKTVACPDCGRTIRPSNLARHRKAYHLPRAERTPYGTALKLPAMPIKVGRKKDRRYDDEVPRGEGPNRFRLYRLRAGDLQLIHAVATPRDLGEALVRLHARGEFVGDDSVGVLDTITEPGSWIISPFTLGRRSTEL